MVQPGKSPFVFARRKQIDDVASPSTSVYGQQVQGVNAFLDRNGVNISARSQASVIDNVQKVETGQRSEVNAHQREAVTFARDAYESARSGQYRQAAVELTGSVVNAGGSVFKSTYTQTPSEKGGVDPW